MFYLKWCTVLLLVLKDNIYFIGLAPAWSCPTKFLFSTWFDEESARGEIGTRSHVTRQSMVQHRSQSKESKNLNGNRFCIIATFESTRSSLYKVFLSANLGIWHCKLIIFSEMYPPIYGHSWSLFANSLLSSQIFWSLSIAYNLCNQT